MVKEDIKSRIKISIIIPYHNESEDVIKPLLKSINEQKKNIDFIKEAFSKKKG